MVIDRNVVALKEEVTVELHLLTCNTRTLCYGSSYSLTVSKCQCVNLVKSLSLSCYGSVKDILCQLNVVSIVGNEVSLTLQCYHSRETVLALYEYTTVRSLTVATLCSDSLSTLAENLFCTVHIAVSLCQCLLYVSKTCASHGTQSLDAFHCYSHCIKVFFKL